jgi:predicted nuclease of predicted toxin-antitoxin system
MEKADDPEIWDYARQHGFSLASKDVDYYERSTLLGHPPKVIWLRCGNQRTSYIERLIRSHLDRIREFEADATASCLEVY